MTTPIGNFNVHSLRELNDLTRNGLQGLGNTQQGESSFKDLLVQSIEHVNTMQQDADAAVETLMTGGDINPAEVLTAVQKADMSFRMMQQVRNKLVQAYQEIKDIRI
jgi:flagellar hook-basal body complex protein FliE